MVAKSQMSRLCAFHSTKDASLDPTVMLSFQGLSTDKSHRLSNQKLLLMISVCSTVMFAVASLLRGLLSCVFDFSVSISERLFAESCLEESRCMGSCFGKY